MSFLASRVRQFISESDHIDALIPFIKELPLDYVKKCVMDGVNQLQESEQGFKVIKAAPIDQLLPSDLLQHCISFVPFQSTLPFVSKKLKNLFSKNKNNIDLNKDFAEHRWNWKKVIFNKRMETKQWMKRMDTELDRIRSEYTTRIQMMQEDLKMVTDAFVKRDNDHFQNDTYLERVNGCIYRTRTCGRCLYAIRGPTELVMWTKCSVSTCKVIECGNCIQRCRRDYWMTFPDIGYHFGQCRVARCRYHEFKDERGLCPRCDEQYPEFERRRKEW